MATLPAAFAGFFFRSPMRLLAALLAGCMALAPALAVDKRSQAAKEAFANAQPCPSTGLPEASCPGWWIDHRFSLCAAPGGTADEVDAAVRWLDQPWNLRWQPVEEARAKDRTERAYCAWLRKLR